MSRPGITILAGSESGFQRGGFGVIVFWQDMLLDADDEAVTDA